MTAYKSTLRIQGEHREWIIRPAPLSFPGDWTITADPIPSESNPLRNPDFSVFDVFTLYPDLTTAYDAYVAAEYADDGTHTEETNR